MRPAEPVARGRPSHEKLCAEFDRDRGCDQDEDTPRLAGQPFACLFTQMALYLDGVEQLPPPTGMAERRANTGPGDLETLRLLDASVR
jgi:hypothetical protein